MALVKKFQRTNMSRNTVHGEVDCTYTTFERNGKRFLQLDTYGSLNREFVGKKSQSLQFGEEALRQLKSIIELLV